MNRFLGVEDENVRTHGIKRDDIAWMRVRSSPRMSTSLLTVRLLSLRECQPGMTACEMRGTTEQWYTSGAGRTGMSGFELANRDQSYTESGNEQEVPKHGLSSHSQHRWRREVTARRWKAR